MINSTQQNAYYVGGSGNVQQIPEPAQITILAALNSDLDALSQRLSLLNARQVGIVDNILGSALTGKGDTSAPPAIRGGIAYEINCKMSSISALIDAIEENTKRLGTIA